MANGIISSLGTGIGSFQVRVVWSSTSNGVEANSSNVTAELQIRKFTSIPTFGTWTVEGTYGFMSAGNSTYYRSIGKEWVTITTRSGVVKHNPDGTKRLSVHISVKAPDGTTLADITKSAIGEMILDKIPQHAYINNVEAGDFNSIETAPTINYTNPAGEDITKLEACISLDNDNDNIPYRELIKTNTTYKFTLTQNDLNTLYSAMPNSNSLTTYILLRSTIGDLVQHTSKEKVFYIKDKNINIDVTVEDINLETLGLTGNKNILIKGFSNAKVTLNASPATIGSTIDEYSIKNDSKTYNSNTGTYEKIENGKFEVSAKDSRGNKSIKEVTNTVINYIPLTCNLSVDMPDIQGNADFYVDGNYFEGSFGAVDNELIVLVRQIIDGVEGEWQAVTDIRYNGNTFSASGSLNGFSQTKECLVEVRVADKLLTKETTQNVLIIPVFDWGISDFNFNVPVTINGDLTINGNINFDYGNQDILWSGAWYMKESQTAELSKPITEQANGVVVVFSRYSEEEPKDYGWNSFFVPKSFINVNNSGGHTFIMATSGFTTIATKYLYFTDTAVKGNFDNELEGTNNGITFNNKDYVLRYIIGV